MASDTIDEGPTHGASSSVSFLVEGTVRDKLLWGEWRKFRILIQDMWSGLTDEDLARVHGNWDLLIDRIEELSGDMRTDIESRIDWVLEIFADSPSARRLLATK